MTSRIALSTFFLLIALMLMAGCSDDDDPITPPQPTSLVVSPGATPPAAANVGPFDSSVEVLQLTLTAGLGGRVRVQAVTFTETGSSDAQTDIDSMALYVDADDDGVYSSAVDTVTLSTVSTGYGGGDTVTFSALDRVLDAGTGESWLLVYNLSGSASTGETFIASVAASADVAAEGADTNLATDVSGPPETGSTFTVQNFGSLTVATGGATPAAGNLPAPPNSVDMFQLRLDAAPTEDIDVTAISFSASGTGDASGDISAVDLYLDADNSGTVTGGDTQIGVTETFSGGTVSFSGFTETLTGGSTNYWLVVCTFSGGNYGDTYAVSFADNADITATGATSSQPIVPSGAPANGNTMTEATPGAMTLSAGAGNPAAGNIANPPTNVLMLQLRLEADAVENIDISAVTFTSGGTGNADTDISLVSLYEDVNRDGTLDGGDAQIGSSSNFSGGTATFSGMSETIDAGAANWEAWLVVCTFTGGNSGDTYTVGLVNGGDLTATGALSSSAITPSGTPVAGNAQTLQIGTLNLAAGANNPTAGPLPVPMTNVPMLQLRLEAGSNEDVTVSAVTFTAGGTGNADTDISSVTLYNDADGSGTITGGDTPIGQVGTFSSGTVSFAGLTETITAGAANWETWLVVCTFVGGASGNTYSVSLANATDVTAAGAASAYSLTPTGSATGNLMVMPAPPLLITTQRLPFGKIGQAYNFTLQATGGTTPYNWTVSIGSLPNGLNLAAATGVISGTPTGGQGAIFTVQVTDAGGPMQSDTQVLAIELDPAGSTLVTVIQGGGGTFTTITSAIAAIPNPLSGTHIIEIQDNATYSENVDVVYTPQGGNAAMVILRSKYDNLPTISAPNASDHAVDIQTQGVTLWGLRITGATGTSMAGVNVLSTAWMVNIRNCVIFGNDVAIDNAGNPGTTITNNTCYGVKGLYVGGGGSCMVYNNIVWVTGAWAHREYPTPAMSCDNNLYYAPNGAVGYDGTTYYTTLAAWQAHFFADGNSQYGNPNLANPTGSDFHITASSNLAIDLGFAVWNIFTDAEGYAGNQGTAWDIGAFEWR
ncbi:MAG: putative Ig domain-containing protein [Planctomycetota bacterium]|jgi:hypothetical protein